MNLKLTNDILTEPCQVFDFTDPPYNPIELSNSLTLFREANKGLGLAANQVGIPYRVISVKGIDTCLFNPKIVYSSVEQKLDVEGCLSFPGLIVKIKRPEYVRVRYANAYGETKIYTYVGLTARIVAHEVDHLDGILFIQRANKFHKEQAMRRYKRFKSM